MEMRKPKGMLRTTDPVTGASVDMETGEFTHRKVGLNPILAEELFDMEERVMRGAGVRLHREKGGDLC